MRSDVYIALFCMLMFACPTFTYQGPVTVSGLSSGGFMAAQMHVAFSDTIEGAAIFAGGPYYCAQGSVITATTSCMATGLITTSTLYSKIQSYAKSGSIDDYSNIADDKVFILDGTNDHTVNPKVGKADQELYEKLGAKIETDYTIKAGHGMPTLSTGVSCSTTASPYINNCGYNGAYLSLNYLYGGDLVEGTTYDKSKIQKIAQKSGSGSSLGSHAYAYVPDACSNLDCALHVVFHGCMQTIGDIKMQYVENTGYNEVAEANGLIILYPQAKSSTFLPSNPNGCWDWWGYTNGNYATQSGVQMKESMRLVQSILNKEVEMTPVYQSVEQIIKNESE